MSRISIFWTGIIGVLLFVIATILGGFQFDNYSHISQYISESYAIGTPYGKALRFLGYIPSGILITIFAFSAARKFPASNLIRIGFYGIGIFYGIATIISGIFPCDKGCNKEFLDPSLSQVIHNLTGLLTYLFVPLSIIILGIGLRQIKPLNQVSTFAVVCGIICCVFVAFLMNDPFSKHAGLYQRIIEGLFIGWIIVSAFNIKNSDPLINNRSFPKG